MHAWHVSEHKKRNERIRFLRSKGWKLIEIAQRYGLTRQRVEQITKPEVHADRRRRSTYVPKPKIILYPFKTVYFVRVHHFVKIGVTRNLDNRLASLQSTCPYKIHLLLALDGTRQLEQQLHERFNSSLRWNEWFHYTKEIRDFIRQRVEGFTEPPLGPQRPAM